MTAELAGDVLSTFRSSSGKVHALMRRKRQVVMPNETDTHFMSSRCGVARIDANPEWVSLGDFYASNHCQTCRAAVESESFAFDDFTFGELIDLLRMQMYCLIGVRFPGFCYSNIVIRRNILEKTTRWGIVRRQGHWDGEFTDRAIKVGLEKFGKVVDGISLSPDIDLEVRWNDGEHVCKFPTEGLTVPQAKGRIVASWMVWRQTAEILSVAGKQC